MKLGWVNGLRGIAALALLTGAATMHGQTPPDATTTNTAAEPIVVAVRIVREDGTVLSEAPAGITVEAGKALDRGKVECLPGFHSYSRGRFRENCSVFSDDANRHYDWFRRGI